MPPASVLIQRRIEWSDTDASGLWHNTAAFRWVEWAETSMFEHLGILDDVYGRLPRVHIEADFKAGLRHKDLIDIELSVASIGESSISYDVNMRRAEQPVATIRCTAVLLDPATRRPTEWPDKYRELLLNAGQLPAELLVTEQRGNQ
jgi:YbgC/YbaW family acyl-CoA thioester hydrolase